MADNNAADDQKKVEGENGEGAAADASGKGDDAEGKDKKSADDKKADDKSGADEHADDDDEPQVRRKSAKDYIIERKQRQLEKAKSAKGEAEKGEGGDDREGDDDEVAPEDEQIISKVVDKKLAPLREAQQKAEDDADIAAFIAKNPDFKAYEAKARKYMAHPSRAHLPVKTIFYEVAGDDLMRLGAKRGKAADDEAAHGRSGGGSDRGVSGGKAVSEMTPAEFSAHKDTVRRKMADRD